jgi:hypothetical protein
MAGACRFNIYCDCEYRHVFFVGEKLKIDLQSYKAEDYNDMLNAANELACDAKRFG